MKKYLFVFLLTIYCFALKADTNKWPTLPMIWAATYATGGGMGSGVFGIGDINNDGYDDVAIGWLGKIAIYYGGDPMDSDVDIWIGDGIAPLVFSDVNGDSAADFIAFKPAPASFDDSVFVYFGGALLDSIPDLKILPDSTINRHNFFGQVCNGTGDFNKDGYMDIIITDYAANITQYSGHGKVYIYYGGEILDNKVDIEIIGDSSHMELGWDVDSGDLNNDGWDDLIIKGFHSFPDSLKYDYIDIYLGGPSQDFSQKDFRIQKNYQPFNRSLGYRLAVLDFNADGFDDIITGNGYIYWGSANFDTTADHFIDNPVFGTWWNLSINAGDINGDGYDDLAFGLPTYAMNSGYVVIYLGGPHPNTSDIPDAGVPPFFASSFGLFIDNAGDVNNDGINDLIISAPGWNGSAVSIYSGDTTLVVNIMEKSAPPLPGAFALAAYPNPFNNSVLFEFELAKTQKVNIDIFNINGQKIITLANNNYSAGKNAIAWNASPNLSSGIYFARLNTQNSSQCIKILLIK